MPPKIIGLTGTFAGGKDTLANYITKEFGYTHFSTGDMVREEAMQQRGSIDRPVLHEVATAMRYVHGAAYFAQKALRKLGDHPGGIVVSGIRTLGEAKAVRAAGGVLVFVDAPVETRYQRMQSRLRDDEAKRTLQEFKDGEAAEWYAGANEEDFNLRDIKRMADVQLENNGTLDDFLQDARRVLHLS